MEFLFIAIAFIGIFAYAILVNGLVTMCFYNWFVQDFFDLPIMEYPEAIGIAFFISLFRAKVIHSDEKNNQYLFEMIVGPWFILLLGLIVKSLIA